jgi:hypothetical protein
MFLESLNSIIFILSFEGKKEALCEEIKSLCEATALLNGGGGVCGFYKHSGLYKFAFI